MAEFSETGFRLKGESLRIEVSTRPGVEERYSPVFQVADNPPGMSFGPLPKQFYLQGLIVFLYFASWGKIVGLFLTTIVPAVWVGLDRIRNFIGTRKDSVKGSHAEEQV